MCPGQWPVHVRLLLQRLLQLLRLQPVAAFVVFSMFRIDQ
jgi:hypothetical protein